MIAFQYVLVNKILQRRNKGIDITVKDDYNNCVEEKRGDFMTNQNEKILNTFQAIIPELDALDKEKLLAFGEGMAFTVA